MATVRTVDIEGFGPIKIQALPKDRLDRLSQVQDRKRLIVALYRRGLVEPHWQSDEAEPLRIDPALAAQVIDLITELSIAEAI